MSEDLEKRLRAHCEGDRESYSGIPIIREAADALSALREKLAAVEGELARAKEWGEERNKIAIERTGHLARATAAEAREAELGRALVKYGDRTRMSNCSDQTMQMAIDGAFARAALTKETGE